MEEGEKVPVMVSKRLYEKIKAKVDGTDEFSSVEEYVSYVLEEILSEGEGRPETSVYTKEEEEEIKSKLQALGYL